MRVRCASPLLTTSRKIASSTWHGERAIIAVRSYLSSVSKKRQLTCMHTHDDKMKHIDIEMKLNDDFLLAGTVPTCKLVIHKIINFICWLLKHDLFTWCITWFDKLLLSLVPLDV